METIQHAMKSMKEYGESAIEVHIWLDCYWNGDLTDHTHRTIRHNDWGLEEGIRKFGEWSRKHILLHLHDDGVILK